MLIYLVGAPGSGKSTLMAKLTDGYVRVPVSTPVAHDILVDPVTGEPAAIEVGRRRATFSGTDALPSSVITAAEPWIASRPARLVLAEGARLANMRFVQAAASTYDVLIALLDHDDVDSWRSKRSAELGKEQNASWVKGRLSASRNLAAKAKCCACVIQGHPDELYPMLVNAMETHRHDRHRHPQ